MRVPLSPFNLPPEVIAAGMETLREGRFTMGGAVARFEQLFAEWVGARHAVMVNSGSSANLLAVEAMLRPSTGAPHWTAGDEVLVPALGWSTTVWPLVQLGLRPVFVDIDPHTLAMDMRQAAQKRTDRTVGVMLVHVLGQSANADRWQQFCDQHDLTLIEDCCESFGAHWGGRHVGTFGTIGTFSHFFSHQLSTMEGGTLVTDHDSIADDLRSMRAHGWTRNRVDRAKWEPAGVDARFWFVTSGYNVRPLELSGAMGVVQLARAEADLNARDATVRALVDVFDQTPLKIIGRNRLLPSASSRKVRSHSWMNLPLLAPEGLRDRYVQQLTAAGIDTRPLLAGNLLRHPALRDMGNPEDFPVTEAVARDGFMMGCHPDVDVQIVADAVIERAA